MEEQEDKRREMDRGEDERRVNASRRENSVGRVDSSDLLPKSDRRADERQKSNKKNSTD